MVKLKEIIYLQLMSHSAGVKQSCGSLSVSCRAVACWESAATIITDSTSNHHLDWPVGRAFDWTERHIFSLKQLFHFTQTIKILNSKIQGEDVFFTEAFSDEICVHLI